MGYVQRMVVGLGFAFVVGSGAQDANRTIDSHDDVEDNNAPKPAASAKKPKTAALESRAKKAKGPHSDGKSGDKPLIHARRPNLILG